MKEFFALGALLLIACSLGACNLEPPWPGGQTEAVRNGAYFSTGKEDGTVVIYNDYLTLLLFKIDKAGGYTTCDVVQFSLAGDSYKGKNIYTKMSFKQFDDILTINKTSFNPSKKKWVDTRMEFKLNPSIKVSEEEPFQLSPPDNVKIYHYDDGLIGLDWRFDKLEDGTGESITFLVRNNGILGACLEVKYAGSEVFEIFAILKFTPEPYCKFSVQTYHLKNMGLTQGTHIIRLKHLGGPFVQWNTQQSSLKKEDCKILCSLDSTPLYYKLTVDLEGKIIAEEISE